MYTDVRLVAILSAPCKGFSRANRNGGKDDMVNNKVCACSSLSTLHETTSSLKTSRLSSFAANFAGH